MDSEDSTTGAGKNLGSRVSVACLPCRNRHVRCDAQQPVCLRCSSEGKTCEYVKSRRGGLTRTKLAERRSARSSSNNNGAVTTLTQSPPGTSPGSGSGSASSGRDAQDEQHQYYQPSNNVFANLLPGYGMPSTTESENSYGGETQDAVGDIEFSSIETDFLIRSYYKHFHRCHPCVLPHRHLQHHYDRIPRQENLSLLVNVMRFIGSLYLSSDLTPQLREKVIEGLVAARQRPPDPFLAQCHILYSIAQYWCAEKVEARNEIDAAIEIVLSLGMNHCQFAVEHGGGDTVLQESWRRTWWQIYCIDAYYAAIKRSPAFPLCEVDVDTELPCEEDEYESGSIPTPKTLDDFEDREFGPENQTFSSFAYLIGATRSIALALSAGLPDAANWLSPRTIAEVDAIIDSWFLLLPKSKREVLKEGNVVDELMFQAQMAVHANLIALHRPFSRLPFHPLEGVSSCLVEPRRRLPAKDSETMHTQRCLQSIEAQLRFLVLPVQPLSRCPFTICMTAAGTHTLLAAIKVVFAGRQLAVARHQLRLVVGYIRALAKVWPQGERNLEEIQMIAKEVLGAKRKTTTENVNATGATMQKTPGVGGVLDVPPDVGAIEGLDGWNAAAAMAVDAHDGLSPYWNLGGDFQADIPVWFSSY